MPINIYRRSQAPDDSLAQAITQGTQGFIQGRKMRQDNEDRTIANAYKEAQIGELLRKSKAYGEPLAPGLTQVGGKVVKDPSYVKPLNNLQQAQLEEINRKKEEALKLKADQEEALKNSAQESIDTIEKVKEGAKYFGPAGDLPSAVAPSSLLPGEYGKRAEWESNINNLLSKKVIEVMNNMKKASKTGATGFGALNKSELDLLKNSSTVINRKLTPDVAMKYLNDLEGVNRKILGSGSGLPSNSKQYGGLPKAKDPIEAEAKAAIQAGADPNAVRARMEQMRKGR